MIPKDRDSEFTRIAIELFEDGEGEPILELVPDEAKLEFLERWHNR